MLMSRFLRIAQDRKKKRRQMPPCTTGAKAASRMTMALVAMVLILRSVDGIC